MALGVPFGVKVVTPDGRELIMQVDAVEPVSDIALLTSVNDQAAFELAQAFEVWQERTTPVRVRQWTLPFRAQPAVRHFSPGIPMKIPRPRKLQKRSIEVYLLTLKNDWISGTVTSFILGSNHRAGVTAFKVTTPIEGGMSGGPVVDRRGHLLGIVSNGTNDGMMPVLDWALPQWARSRIMGA
jgi:S1-C subfamily serine protease